MGNIAPLNFGENSPDTVVVAFLRQQIHFCATVLQFVGHTPESSNLYPVKLS